MPLSDETAEKHPAPAEGPGWDAAASSVVACLLAALAQGYAEALWRLSDEVPWSSHWIGIHGLYAAVGALLGLFVIGASRLEPVAVSWVARRFFEGRRQVVLGSIYYALLAVSLSYSTAVWTFSGGAIQKTLWGTLGPPAFLVFLFLLCGLLSHHVKIAKQRAAMGSAWRARGLALALVFGAAALTYVDQTVYLHLYDRLHEYLEWCALVLLVVAGTLLLEPISKKPWLLRTQRGLALGACLWLLAMLGSGTVREAVDSRLTHAWLEPVHAGRMLKRAQEIEARIRHPWSDASVPMLRVERLRERYHLRDTTLASKWRDPSRATPTPKGLPPRSQDYNVVVFYVDTLRYDVAHDPEIMPNVARFAGESLNFRKAYATGSDTLRSLPGLTGGNYFVRHTHENDLCEVAKRSHHRSALFIAKSAHEFLTRLRPSFGLDEVFDVPDYPEGKEVWGYGADQSSARGIVDQALDYLEKHKAQKSFLWLFHFDQHNWRELDDKYVDTVRTKYNVPEEGVLNSRYRAVATAIDGEFARFRDGVEQLGLSDKTLLLFVSDHGEGLGDGGFWVHSVFLWETLVHVPLMLKVPGLAPENVDSVVSLVDVAPTLTRFLEPRPTLSGYHGQDLIERAQAPAGERRFPVLFASALRDQLVRVGMVTETGDSKLVVRLEAALPELHDLTAGRPDDKNLAPERPALTRSMLEELARSPLFPREHGDFPMLEPKGPMKFSAPESSLTLRTD